jgi:chromosome partitioning protein
MVRIIAVANHKGGVGKTTTVESVGAVLSSKGYNVLLVDLDAQANLTTSLLGDEPDHTIYEAIKKKSDLPVTKLRDHLYIVPSSLDLSGIDLEIGGELSREYILKDLLEPISDRYDFILIDCAPSLGLLTINAFVAASEVIIPLTAEALPSKGLKKLQEFIAMVRKRLNPSLRISGILITRWIKKKLSQMVEEQLRANYGNTVFRTKIRENVSLAEAPLTGQDITIYSPASNGATDYKEVTEEIINYKQ